MSLGAVPLNPATSSARRISMATNIASKVANNATRGGENPRTEEEERERNNMQ